MPSLTLVIGNKRFSSWSLRPWLALRQAGARFDEVLIPLYTPGSKERILEHAPSGKVPALLHGGLAIWESLAICEYVAELFPEAGLWPEDAAARAVCRSVSAEMHAGFAALRQTMSMDLCRQGEPVPVTPETAADIARIEGIWRDARARFGAGGPFLFGRFSVADAMFAPVCTRFRSYGVDSGKAGRDYMEAVLGLPAMREWYAAAQAEPWVIG